MTRERFGVLPDGREVEAITLAGAGGFSARVLTYGAALHTLLVPDRDGRPVDVALGHATLDEYRTGTAYMGATVGRFANRIAHGRFELDGRTYRVPTNDGENALHGGPVGLNRAVWEVVALSADAVRLRHVSPDGDQGFPGTLAVEASYALGPGDTLRIEYRATTDAPTIVNISSHAYWNLAGEGSVKGAMGHRVTIPADRFLPTDAGAIPTGEFRPVEGTPFDFRRPHAVGERVRDAADRQIAFGRGYDHNWVLGEGVTDDLRLTARAEEPRSGRGFELWSNQPGLQFYSGNFLDGTTRGKSGRLYRQGDALVFEPQIFPDTPNHPEFGSGRLDPGGTYLNRFEYRFTRGG